MSTAAALASTFTGELMSLSVIGLDRHEDQQH